MQSNSQQQAAGRGQSAFQKRANLVSPGFSELSRTSLMYADYIMSHGGAMPNLITDQSLLAEFERINALE